MKKIYLTVGVFLNLILASNVYAFGYPRDNFQKMLEFVHQRDEIRNLRQEPYRQPFNLREERGNFNLERDYYGDYYSGYEDYAYGYNDYDYQRKSKSSHSKNDNRNYEPNSDYYSYWPY